MKPIAATATLAAALFGSAAMANDFAPAMQNFLDTEIRAWAEDPIIVAAIIAQNAAHEGLQQSEIDALDAAWMAEVGTADTPTIAPVLGNAVSDFLRQRSAESGGVITEIFVMDNLGLNVATSDVTSDYWQGDEAKFTETFLQGAGAAHFSEIEFDESSQTFQGQISMTIVDPQSGEPIGAMTIGVNAESLM